MLQKMFIAHFILVHYQITGLTLEGSQGIDLS